MTTLFTGTALALALAVSPALAQELRVGAQSVSDYLDPGEDHSNVGSQFYYNAFDKGFTLLTLGAEQVTAEFVKVSTVRSPEYFASVDATFHCALTEDGMTHLTRPMSGGTIIEG